MSTYSQNDQNFNAVERVLYYTELPREGEATMPDDPPLSWPEAGAVEFKDVVMAYRQGLPPVLKGVTFQVKPGEKVDIVGRTGAGKSSLLQALCYLGHSRGHGIPVRALPLKHVRLIYTTESLSTEWNRKDFISASLSPDSGRAL